MFPFAVPYYTTTSEPTKNSFKIKQMRLNSQGLVICDAGVLGLELQMLWCLVFYGAAVKRPSTGWSHGSGEGGLILHIFSLIENLSPISGFNPGREKRRCNMDIPGLNAPRYGNIPNWENGVQGEGSMTLPPTSIAARIQIRASSPRCFIRLNHG